MFIAHENYGAPRILINLLFKSVAPDDYEDRAVPVSFIPTREQQGFWVGSYFKKNENTVTWEIHE